MYKQHDLDIFNESSDSILLRNSFVQLAGMNKFDRFDYYLIRKWAGTDNEIEFEDLTDDEIMTLRKIAHRNFNKVIKGKNVANSRTVKKWFGFDEFARPKREMMFKLAFALELTSKEASDYLVKGMLAPSFQINDYRELIYMYGLDNGLSYEDCLRMISVYERQADYATDYIQGNYTEKLWEMYAVNKACKPEEFIVWMLEHEAMFKGYSKTVLDCFLKLTEDIQECIRRDAREYLCELIEQNGYYQWKSSGNRSDDMKELVPVFIRRLQRMNEGEDKKSIVKSMKSAYALAFGESRNTNIIKNIYMHEDMLDRAYNNDKFVNRAIGTSFNSRTDKYISQILSVSVQKAYLMQLRSIMASLNDLEDTVECPENIINILAKHGVKSSGINNVAACRKKVSSLIVNQTQNCEMIGRDDILPLVHYLAQRQYANMMRGNKQTYDMEQARNYFENLANAVLSKCQMVAISPKYKLDYLMLSSYCTEDMYSLADLMEALADFGGVYG